jgi:hypothetical protein
VAVLALFLIGPGEAQAGLITGGGGAQSTFYWTFTNGTGTTGSGSLLASANGDGTFTALSGTGVVHSADFFGAINLVADPVAPGNAISHSHYFFYDDQLHPGHNPLLTAGGLLFTTTSNTPLEVNIFGNGADQPSSYYENNGTNTKGTFTLSSASLSVNPGGVINPALLAEPASLTLLGCGIAGLAFLGWQRRRHLLGQS